jgi:dissimilatory sulfite reductase (desulfoviridin) alpha/beta subunit
MNHCYRCHGCTVRDCLEDLRVGDTPIEGYKCINCGACGDLPDASWKRQGVRGYQLQVEGGR